MWHSTEVGSSPSLFYNFAVEDCVLNKYVDDTSATYEGELLHKLQICTDDISNWFSINKLCTE